MSLPAKKILSNDTGNCCAKPLKKIDEPTIHMNMGSFLNILKIDLPRERSGISELIQIL